MQNLGRAATCRACLYLDLRQRLFALDWQLLCVCSTTGPNLWWKMTTSFGYLNQRGYGGHKFPIVIGETGSYLASVHTSAYVVPCFGHNMPGTR